MATAAQVTKAILQEILVQASESSLEADEIQDTIFAMNNYMTALDADGVHLGYTIVNNLSDEITVPAGALQGLISQVAVMVAPQFDRPITPELLTKAKIGMSAMRKLGVIQEAMSFPNTLPLGSGNEGSRFSRYRKFYHNDDDTLPT